MTSLRMVAAIVALLALRACSGGDAQREAVHVHRTANCSCCPDWVSELRRDRFEVTVETAYETRALAGELGIPTELRSCQVAFVGGYFLQGAVPPAAIRKLLAERPDARGLYLPARGDGISAPEPLIVFADGKMRIFEHGH